MKSDQHIAQAIADGIEEELLRLRQEQQVAFVKRNAWQVARVKTALADAKSDAPGIPHQAIEDWIDSFDTDHELPPPASQS